MLRVFVALGKQLPKNKAMIEDTEEVARLLAKYNCTMVQGGAKMGLMGVVVEEFRKYSDDIVMIVPEVHKNDLKGVNIKESYIVEGESDRMKITINTCDMMVVLPGGSGTLAEIAYYNETCKSGEHDAKIVIVNTKGFYNKLFKFHKHQINSGFMTEDACKYEVINNAKQLESIIQQLITKKQAAIQQEQVENNKEDLIKETKEMEEVKPMKATKASTKKAQDTKKIKENDTLKIDKKTSKTTTKKVAKVQPKKEVAKPAKAEAKATTKSVAIKPAVAKKTASKAVKSKVVAPAPIKKEEVKKIDKVKPVASKAKSSVKETVKSKPVETKVKSNTTKSSKVSSDSKSTAKATAPKTTKTSTPKKATKATTKSTSKADAKKVGSSKSSKVKTTTKPSKVKATAKKSTTKK